jgi:hypothetical protein
MPVACSYSFYFPVSLKEKSAERIRLPPTTLLKNLEGPA